MASWRRDGGGGGAGSPGWFVRVPRALGRDYRAISGHIRVPKLLWAGSLGTLKPSMRSVSVSDET